MRSFIKTRVSKQIFPPSGNRRAGLASVADRRDRVDFRCRAARGGCAAISGTSIYRDGIALRATTASLTRTFFRHIESGLFVSGYSRRTLAAIVFFLFHRVIGLDVPSGSRKHSGPKPTDPVKTTRILSMMCLLKIENFGRKSRGIEARPRIHRGSSTNSLGHHIFPGESGKIRDASAAPSGFKCLGFHRHTTPAIRAHTDPFDRNHPAGSDAEVTQRIFVNQPVHIKSLRRGDLKDGRTVNI